MGVWPSAELLSQWLMENSEVVIGKDVLEVGAGPGLVGLLAAAMSARRVVLTDCNQEVLQLLRSNVKNNGVEGNAEIMEFDWEMEGASDSIGAQFDVVLGSDVVYSQSAGA